MVLRNLLQISTGDERVQEYVADAPGGLEHVAHFSFFEVPMTPNDKLLMVFPLFKVIAILSLMKALVTAYMGSVLRACLILHQTMFSIL